MFLEYKIDMRGGKFLIIFFRKFFVTLIIFHYIFFNLSENFAKYNQVVAKLENIMYTI